MASGFFAERKRARQSRAQETQGAIVEAASRIVYEGGAEGFSTNRIAELAGVSIGSLYQYFPGKDAILHALVRREFGKVTDRIVSHVESIDSSSVSLEDGVASIVDCVFGGHRNQGPLYRKLAMSVLSVEHLRFTLENDQRITDAVRSKVAEYPDVSIDESALFVALYSMKGVQIGCVLANRTFHDQALRDAMVRAILAAVAPDRASR